MSQSKTGRQKSSKIVIYTDGASRGNPGLAGAGAVIATPNTQENLAVFLGRKTNNEAEYLALLMALRYLVQLFKINAENDQFSASQIVVKLDSQLVVKQLNSEWKIKNERMRRLSEEVDECCQQLPCPIQFEHVRREKNELADWLANQAIDLAHRE